MNDIHIEYIHHDTPPAPPETYVEVDAPCELVAPVRRAHHFVPAILRQPP